LFAGEDAMERKEYIFNDFSPHDTEKSWYVIHCRSGKEYTASGTLKKNLQVPVYVPEMHIWERNKASVAPFFPGYFFIQINLHTISLNQIKASPGVLYLLTCQGMPQSVPVSVITALSDEIRRFNARQSMARQHLQPGDTLLFKEGLLSGLDGTFLNSRTSGQRIQVLLSCLDRAIKVDMSATALEHIEKMPAKRPRYTRGHGRKTRIADMSISRNVPS
jgi:transcriptional antiterminator RfaH